MCGAGIDFGNLSTLIGQAGKGGVDVILNDSSNRQTASCISFQGKQRLLGDAAATIARSNVANTITNMKLLVGRKFDSEDVQRELKRIPFTAVRMPNGGIGVKVSYKDEPLILPVEQAMAMMLVKAKDISAKANNNVGVAEAVLAVPFWFTDAQRRGVLTACELASLNCLKVSNESTAIALSYGIFKSAKKLFSETDPAHVMFIDMGYTGYTVTVVDFIQENMKVLSTVCSREVGGRDFDDVIIEFIAENFQKKYNINVRGNWKALLKMQVAAEKAKKTLSPTGVSEASISVECLAEDRDFSQVLTKEEFDRRSQHLIDRLAGPIHQALNEAGLTREQINEVEIVGGTTRIGVVKKTLGEILGLDASAMNFGLKTTMNSDEAVARGSALQCAILSSRMKVKPFNIVDRLPYGIVAHFEASAPSAAAASNDDSKEDVQVSGSSAAIYVHNDEVPHKPRRLTFRRKTADFTVTLAYDDAAQLPAGEDRVIGKYTIRVPASLVEKNGPGDVRVNFNLDKHGLVYVQSAQYMEEVAVEEPAPPAPAAEGKEDSKDAAGSKDEKGADAEPAAPKKKFRKIDLDVHVDVFGLSREDIRQGLDLESKLQYEGMPTCCSVFETANRLVYFIQIVFLLRLRTRETNLNRIFTACDLSWMAP
jgi:heat shock protein 4